MSRSAVFMEICQSQTYFIQAEFEDFVISYCSEVRSISYGFPQRWCNHRGFGWSAKVKVVKNT